jgi:heme/copper-type cytochrome/quinol oxidase subunit 3
VTAAVKHQERTALMGMAIFVASWAMLFAALFFAYGLSRMRAVSWPPADLPPLPLALPALATLALAGSSAALHRGRVRIGAALGLLFLLLQAVVWRQMVLGGLRPQAGAYASFFFALTVFHALHVLVGLVALGWLALRPRPLSLRLWTIYWHMVGVIWGVMFLLVYVL